MRHEKRFKRIMQEMWVGWFGSYYNLRDDPEINKFYHHLKEAIKNEILEEIKKEQQ